jgi:hypothetical protein
VSSDAKDDATKLRGLLNASGIDAQKYADKFPAAYAEALEVTRFTLKKIGLGVKERKRFARFRERARKGAFQP